MEAPRTNRTSRRTRPASFSPLHASSSPVKLALLKAAVRFRSSGISLMRHCTLCSCRSLLSRWGSSVKSGLMTHWRSNTPRSPASKRRPKAFEFEYRSRRREIRGNDARAARKRGHARAIFERGTKFPRRPVNCDMYQFTSDLGRHEPGKSGVTVAGGKCIMV